MNSALVATVVEECCDPVDVAVISFCDQFRELWDFRRDGCLLNWWLARPRTLVVVWDCTPRDESFATISTREYVTAFDWAVAFALATERADRVAATEPRATARNLVIIDLASRQQPGAPAVLALPILQRPRCPLIEWLTIIAPAQVPDFLARVRERRTVENQNSSAILKPLWTQWLTAPADPEDRHAVANLIGPRLFLGQEARNITGPGWLHSAAVGTLLEELDLLPATDAIPPAVSRSLWEDEFETILLVDDLANLGWSVLLQFLMEARDHELVVCSRPDDDTLFGGDQDRDLLSTLESALAGKTPAGESSWLGYRRPILFLDLRLFGSRLDVSDKHQFIRRLTDIAAAAITQSQPWQPISTLEIQRVRQWLDEGAPHNDQRSQIALSLLPRLLALADPLMPIVIFSTSTQRALADLLWPYGNIILDFSKPVFFGAVSQTPISETVSKLATALGRARKLGNASSHLANLARVHGPEPMTTVVKRSLVEIYIDESGSGNALAVGGLVAGYPDAKAPAQFSRALREAGLAWGHDCDSLNVAAPPDCLRKASSSGDEVIGNSLRRVADLARQHNILLAAFKLGPVVTSDKDFILWRGPDALYRHLMAQSVEILLYDWLPSRGMAKTTADINLYAATRLLAGNGQDLILLQRKFGLDLRDFGERKQEDGFCRVLATDDLAKEWQEGCERVGFLSQPGRRDLAAIMPIAKEKFRALPRPSQAKVRAYSFGFDDFYPILREAFAQHGRALPISRAVGVGLSYYGGFSRTLKPHQLPRQLHYAADYVVSKPDICPAEWWQHGFRESDNETFNRLAETSRAIDRGNPTQALLHWAGYSAGSTGDQLGVAQCVAKRLKHLTSGMSGLELMEFARSL